MLLEGMQKVRLVGFGVARVLYPRNSPRIFSLIYRHPHLRSPIRMAKLHIALEFWRFLRMRKKYWLTPIVVVLLLLSLLIVFTQGSALAPFIYALF